MYGALPPTCQCEIALEARPDLVNFVITKATKGQHDCGTRNNEQQASRACSRIAGEEQGHQSEQRTDSIERKGYAALRPAARQKHVMNMFSIALKHGTPAQETAHDRK